MTDEQRMHRTFTVAPSTIGPTFSIEVKAPDSNGDAPISSEDFACLSDVPPGVLNDYLAEYARPDANQQKALSEFIIGVLTEDDEKRFRDLVHSKRIRLGPEVIAEIASFLVEAYSGRPLDKLLESSAGPPKTAVTSPPASPSEA